MKQKLIITKGLPASGKTTWAKDQVIKSGGKIKRINKDDLRDMIDAGKWSKANEKEIIIARDLLINSFLVAGYSVIVDDTNFAPEHARNLAFLAGASGADFEIKFFDVPVDECIKRDLKRGEKVGEKVIRKMYNQYLRQAPKYKEFDIKLPACIICDIDGTLAHMNGRSPFDWKRVGDDSVDEWIKTILLDYNDLFFKEKIILLSGRDSVCRPETEKWLADNNIPYDELYMRPEKDNRSDVIIKEELYNQHIKDKYNVFFVLDDRKQVVDMWRRIGLKCLQVEEGNF